MALTVGAAITIILARFRRLRNERIAKSKLERRFGLDGEAFLGAEIAGVGRVNRDSILISEALSLNVFDAVLLEGDFLADADITLDAEVSEFAAFGARLMGHLFV